MTESWNPGGQIKRKPMLTNFSASSVWEGRKCLQQQQQQKISKVSQAYVNFWGFLKLTWNLFEFCQYSNSIKFGLLTWLIFSVVCAIHKHYPTPTPKKQEPKNLHLDNFTTSLVEELDSLIGLFIFLSAELRCCDWS